MARNSTARGKVVRRLGVNIFGNRKYDRLLKRKSNNPGQERGKRQRNKQSDFAKQLIEKQKLKFAYGLSEKQFLNNFKKAKGLPGLSGDNMMILLERRLDNVVYRLGWAISRAQARQLVSHGHVRLNGKRSSIASIIVREGDEIFLKEKETSSKMVRENLSKNDQGLPSWLTMSEDDLKGRVERLPFREDIPSVANEQMVVEFYSK